MSVNTYPVFFNSQLLAAANGTLYTVPATPTTQILQELQLKITNTTAATHTATIYAVPSGGSASAVYAVATAMPVPPYDYIIVPVTRLEASGTIEGYADTADVLSVQAIGGKLHTP